MRAATFLLAAAILAACGGGGGDDAGGNVEKFCEVRNANLFEYDGGEKQAYRDMVKYAPSAIRADMAFEAEVMADLVRQGEEGLGDDGAQVPRNVLESMDRIAAFVDANC